jgi:hypothetical protein
VLFCFGEVMMGCEEMECREFRPVMFWYLPIGG